MIKKIIFLFIFYLFFNPANAKEDFMILKLKNGEVQIELFGDIAPVELVCDFTVMVLTSYIHTIVPLIP